MNSFFLREYSETVTFIFFDTLAMGLGALTGLFSNSNCLRVNLLHVPVWPFRSSGLPDSMQSQVISLSLFRTCSNYHWFQTLENHLCRLFLSPRSEEHTSELQS